MEYIKNWQSGWWSLLRMFIAINKEGHQTIEAVVKITMNGGIIGYNRLMLVCQVNGLQSSCICWTFFHECTTSTFPVLFDVVI